MSYLCCVCLSIAVCNTYCVRPLFICLRLVYHMLPVSLDCPFFIDTLALIPGEMVTSNNLASPSVVPVISLDSFETTSSFKNGTRMVQLDGWDPSVYSSISSSNPDLMISIRMSFEAGWQQQLNEMIDAGVSVIHFVANNHGVADGGGGFEVGGGAGEGEGGVIGAGEGEEGAGVF